MTYITDMHDIATHATFYIGFSVILYYYIEWNAILCLHALYKLLLHLYVVPPPAGQRSPGNSGAVIPNCVLYSFNHNALCCMVTFSFQLQFILKVHTSTITLSSFPALIAGVVVALLVVVVLLLLVGGVVTVVLWVRRKKMMEAGQSNSKAEDSPHEGEVKINMYQNVNNQPTAASGHNEPYYSTAVDTFINPASATASFKTHMYDSANEIDREPIDVGGGELNEEAKVEERWDGGGYHKEPEKHVSGKQKKSAVRKVNTRLVNPEDLYAEPNKVKKKNAKKDSQASRTEETAVPSDELYAKPDMTKKKDQRSKQDSEQERKLPPQAPLSYKKHKEAMHESEEDGEDVPEVPPPYVPDEEQCYNTRGGAGPSFLERIEV